MLIVTVMILSSIQEHFENIWLSFIMNVFISVKYKFSSLIKIMEQEVIISTYGLLNFAGFFELSQLCMYIYMYVGVYGCMYVHVFVRM